jgi:hypothetical protein
MTNEERAAQVEGALEAFAQATGLEIEADGPETVAGDMIAGILHWVQSISGGERNCALNAARSGIGHYVTESNIDYAAKEVDELGPDAFVTIYVACDGENWWSTTGQGTVIR